MLYNCSMDGTTLVVVFCFTPLANAMSNSSEHYLENAIVAVSFTITIMIIVALLFHPSNLSVRLKEKYQELCNRHFEKENLLTIINGLSSRKNIAHIPYIIHTMSALSLLGPLFKSNREYGPFTPVATCFASIGLITLHGIFRYNKQYKLCIHITAFQVFIATVMCHTGLKRLLIFNIVTFIIQYINIKYQWLSQHATLRIYNTSHHISLLCGILYLNTIITPFYAHLWLKYNMEPYKIISIYPQ